MNPLNILILVYASIILWFPGHYFWTTRHDRYLNRKIKQAAPKWKDVDCDEYMNQLRDYGNRCQIKAERKARDERC